MLDNSGDTKRAALLISIVSQKDTDLDKQLYYALESTCNLLGLEIAIISRIHSDTYIIEQYFPSGVELYKGQEFELGNTYCSITLDSEGPFSVPHMAESEYNMHPCYNAFHLESYIGIPLEVNGEIYGTINFSSSHPKEHGFSNSDHDLITLLGEWASGIIQRKMIEAELEREKELYKLASTNSTEMICLHQPDGIYTYISDSSLDIIGYHPEELIGTNPYDLIHPDDAESYVRPSHKKTRSGTIDTSVEYRIKTKDGEYIWLNTSVQPITDDSGKVVSLQTISRDISEKKRIEILFHESQQMAHVGGWEYDLKTGQLYWSDEVYRIHDKEIGEEIFVEEGVSYFPNESRTRIEKAIEHTIATGEQYDLELDFISAKGIHKSVRAIGKAEIENGKAYKLHGTFQDITERKKNQDMITEQNERLFQEKETKEKLYSLLSHDVRNSLFGITSFLELTMQDIAEDAFDKDETIERLEMLLKSAKGSLNLLMSIQGWIKMQAGYFTKKSLSFNLIDEIEKVKNLFQAGLSQKQISLNDTSSDIGYIPAYGDPEMIATILRNFLNNAIKYSQIGGAIDITLTSETETVNISIRDYGIGMPESVLNDLFDFNNRPQRSGTDNEPGTGLGLMLCAELAEQNNAPIIVKSVENKGTEMILKIPSEEDSKSNHTIELIPRL